MVAVHYVRAIVALMVVGIVYWAGNIAMFSSGGVVTLLENASGPSDYGTTADMIRWAWQVWPIVAIIGIAVYVIYASIREEAVVRRVV